MLAGPSTALVRSIGLAVLGILASAWAVYVQSGDWRTAITAAIAAASAIIAGRGLGEGMFDRARQATGAVADSDVQPAGQGKA